MVDQILRDQADAFFGADDGLQRGPLRLKLLFVLQFLALCRLLEVRVDLWLLLGL